MTELPHPHEPHGLFDYAAKFFSCFLHDLVVLRGRLQIRTCLGDITEALEKLRYEPGEEIAKPKAEKIQDVGLRKFDRDHLSNMP